MVKLMVMVMMMLLMVERWNDGNSVDGVTANGDVSNIKTW